MSSVQVRPFRRSDRDQLTRLVNAHAEAVVPGLSVSVNTVCGACCAGRWIPRGMRPRGDAGSCPHKRPGRVAV
jgi:hypothetical protein